MGSRILWQRLDLPGHEICTLHAQPGDRQLAGIALFAHEGEPCHLTYRIECDERWQTRSVLVWGEVGERPVSVELARNSSGAWQRNGIVIPEVDGCIDVDLGFSPATNLLPVRRLALPIGGSARVRAAWVRFPELSLELLDQAYTRIDEDRYLYESASGQFRKELLTDRNGFVTEYPGFWRTVAIESDPDLY